MRSTTEEFFRILGNSGRVIADIRASEGLSQADLAELTGLHCNTVATIERGECDPSILVQSLIYVHLRLTGISFEHDIMLPVSPPRSEVEGPAFPPQLITLPRMAEIIGTRVRERRCALGLTMAEMAFASNLHLNTVWNIERGLVSPAASTVYRLYRSLGITRVEAGGSDIMLL